VGAEPRVNDASFEEAARRVRLVAFDVDGVLTDGGIYLGAAGAQPVELKRYDIQDGLGMYFLRRAGLQTAIVTGRVSESVRMRARELDVDHLAQDPQAQKLPALTRIATEAGVSFEQIAFVGDDLPDLSVMRRVGLPVAVGNAAAEVRAAAAITLTRTGGAGAVREFVERLLKARGEWDGLVESYVAERSMSAVAVGA
jgi:3-deoxy-D-manno-octulosonate 8-phosphate phosphatase (KDO 8-P phosphatase)